MPERRSKRHHGSRRQARVTKAAAHANEHPDAPSQRIVQVCLFLFAAIGFSGGALQMYLGQPETTPRLDNVHRFLAGIYFGCGLICLWAGITVRQQRTLVLLLGLAVFLAGCGAAACRCASSACPSLRPSGSATSCLSSSCRFS